MGFEDWQEVSRKKHGYMSKEDNVAKISTSIFITNFPESTSAKDLYNACKVYGHVVDSFIPNKRAKNGKRFAFIKFINLFSVDRLVSNLCTVWIAKHRLQANIAKFSRPSVNQNVKELKSRINYNFHKVGASSRPSVSSVPTHVKGRATSFVNVVNGSLSGTQDPLMSSPSAIVIDDSCLVERDVSKQVLGKVKEFASIPKLSLIINDEGFSDVKLTYLGGAWVLFEFINVETKENFMCHPGINSWFEVIKEACNDFVSEERIVWMDIEGIPLNAWSRETFVKIGKKCCFRWFGMGFEDRQEVSRKKRGYMSKEDDVAKISTSIFVTNFSESTSAKDLYNACKVYGHVVDSFIPNKRAENGKRFAFIKFINVFSVDRLVSNLCTVWIVKHRLQANIAKFSRPSVNQNVKEVKSRINYNFHKVWASSRPSVSSVPTHVKGRATSFVNVVNGSLSGTKDPLMPSPSAIVIDDSCLVERDVSKQVMVKVKEFVSIPKLSLIINDEGFSDVKLTYLGGAWVLFEFINVKTKENFMCHPGINSWFEVIKEACNDFVSEERIVWMDIEGIPLNAWSRETFVKIGKKSGEALDVEDSADTSFGRKRICVMTKHPVCILETFKVIVKGRVFLARAKELFTWNPSFTAIKEKEYASEDESIHISNNNEFHQHINEEDLGDKYDSEEEGVPETVFGSNASSYRKVDDDKGIFHCLLDESANDFGEHAKNTDKDLMPEPPTNFSTNVMNDSQNIPEENHMVYAPQEVSRKRALWDYISHIIGRWNGEAIVMGDFNEVRTSDERRGSCFNTYGAKHFDRFISNSGLVDVNLEGYTFTWSHPTGAKMSKLDRFLISDGILHSFPSIAAICLDRHLSNHRPILLREVQLDFGPIQFRFYHSWFDYVGFDDLIETAWLSFSHSDIDAKIDRDIEGGLVDDGNILRRTNLKNNLLKITEMEAKDRIQKSKVKWAVEGDENSKFFHGIINKRRSHLAIKGVFDDGIWQSDLNKIKNVFVDHFEGRFKDRIAQ
nr:RNA-directed DNA polymerase, eukaryota [Tanacetum cinerariifolium]